MSGKTIYPLQGAKYRQRNKIENRMQIKWGTWKITLTHTNKQLGHL